MNAIEWESIARAIRFYKMCQYQYVETPWYVDYETAMITCPHERNLFKLTEGNKTMVGSAEQGFLQMVKDEKIGDGFFVSAGPCFRNENVDDTHHKQFFKVELFGKFHTESECYAAHNKMLKDAIMCMECIPKTVLTDDGYDLEINDIEVGSYGTRYHPDVGYWAYGTGIAEPRYSFATSLTCRE